MCPPTLSLRGPPGASDTGKPSPPSDGVRHRQGVSAQGPRVKPPPGIMRRDQMMQAGNAEDRARSAPGRSPSKRQPLSLPHRQRLPSAREETHSHLALPVSLHTLSLSPLPRPLTLLPPPPPLAGVEPERLHKPTSPARRAWPTFAVRGHTVNASSSSSQPSSQLFNSAVAAPELSWVTCKQISTPCPSTTLYTKGGREFGPGHEGSPKSLGGSRDSQGRCADKGHAQDSQSRSCLLHPRPPPGSWSLRQAPSPPPSAGSFYSCEGLRPDPSYSR